MSTAKLFAIEAARASEGFSYFASKLGLPFSLSLSLPLSEIRPSRRPQQSCVSLNGRSSEQTDRPTDRVGRLELNGPLRLSSSSLPPRATTNSLPPSRPPVPRPTLPANGLSLSPNLMINLHISRVVSPPPLRCSALNRQFNMLNASPSPSSAPHLNSSRKPTTFRIV